MGIISKISETVEERLKKSQRIINLKLSSYESNYNLQLLLTNYKVYFYDVKSGKIRMQKPIIKTVLDIIFWLAKCILFTIECYFPVFVVSPSSVLSLLKELGDISLSLNENTSQKSIDFLCQLSKHIRIRKKPYKKYRKIKKIVCVPIDDSTPNEIRTSVELISDLIESNRINNCSLVILAKISMQTPAQEVLNFYNDEEKNLFIADFKVQFLNDLLNENYVGATKFIQEILNENSMRVSEFEFMLQCLAFCYKNMNENEFIDVFSQSNIKINDDLNICKARHFIYSTGQNNTFLCFCYSYFEHFYSKHPRINHNELDVTFKIVTHKIKTALIAKDEYFSAVKLLSVYSSCEEAVDNYIIASVHMEYVKNCINDECIMLIKEYVQRTERAELFMQLLNLNRDETPDKAMVNSILEYIIKLENADPILRLCFMYYLVNPIYKCGSCEKTFMDFYKHLLSSAIENLQTSKALLCLFAIQYLLLYSTIEEVPLHKNNAKFASRMFDYVNINRVLIENKKIYYKLVRSINGISVDDFESNLAQMQGIKDRVGEYITENILFSINFGVLYAYNGNIKAAINVYRGIKKNILNEMPLSVRASYFNNHIVFVYLNNPTKKMAKSAVESIISYLNSNYKNGIITEEYIHLNLNLLIFQIIANEQTKLNEIFETVRNMISNDKYYSFYFTQAKWLFNVLHGEIIEDSPLPESVFFCNKKSFFEHKKRILNEFISEHKSAMVSEINKYLENRLRHQNNYEYFKRIETFSLIERWYE